jgi:c-di-GMP-binding flagellar brake protein YcgR
MPVRLGVQLEGSEGSAGATILRALDLSAGGILLLDPQARLSPPDRVRMGLPIGPAKGIVRLTCRVIRVQEDPRRVALIFEGIGETARQLLLRYLFREHRRRNRRLARKPHRRLRVTSIREIRS